MKYTQVNGTDYQVDNMRKLAAVDKNNAYGKAPLESGYVAAHPNRGCSTTC